MRVKGRRLYPDNLDERRVLMTVGGVPLVCPRSVNIYVVKRRLERAANRNVDILFARDVVNGRTRSAVAMPAPQPSPEPDHSEPSADALDRSVA